MLWSLLMLPLAILGSSICCLSLQLTSCWLLCPSRPPPAISLRNSTLILTRTNCGCYCPVDHFKQKQNNNRSAPSVLQWSWWENLVNNWARYLSPAYLKHILVMSCGSIPFVMQHNAQWITQPTWPSTHLNFWTCSQQQTGCLVMAPTFLNEVLSHTVQEQWICIYNSGT